MTHRMGFLRLLGAGTFVAAVAVAVLVLRVRHDVRQAVAEPVRDVKPLDFTAVRLPGPELEAWGGSEIGAVATHADLIYLAGASGLFEIRPAEGTPSVARRLDGLPSRAVSALTLWRGSPVVGLLAGGLFVRQETGWREVASGWGRLEVRVLVETEGGELYVGARQGLFRVAFGSREMERLDVHPVRALAVGPGFAVAGGEEGLRRIEGLLVTALNPPDPWIDGVALAPKGASGAFDLWVISAAGLARGPVDGALLPVAGGERVTSGVLRAGLFYGVEEPDGRAAGGTAGSWLRRFEPGGGSRLEPLSAAVRRVFALAPAGVSDPDDDGLVADTDEGPWWTTKGQGWRPMPVTLPPSLPAGSAHVTALAVFEGRVVGGVFDGGLIRSGDSRGANPGWSTIPGARAWGVNSLLAAGGALHVASLRGAARLIGDRLEAIGGTEEGTASGASTGAGAAFSLAATPEGIAIGYAQGVKLPNGRLLSAFHGLPGNQALALAAAGPMLFVGTPSGLGAIREGRVSWRMTAGEEKLPNPWITALLVHDQVLFVGTFGGGLARRSVPDLTAVATSKGLARVPALEPFAETEGWKVNPGCLVSWQGRVFAGTDDHGLVRLGADGSHFDSVGVTLPSSRVTALTASSDGLYIGTDQGLARLEHPEP